VATQRSFDIDGDGVRAVLKTLSVRQPWASLIMSGAKDVENRTWSTNYRGRLAIHAASRPDSEGVELYPDVDGPLGAILGTVELLDVVDDSRSKWARPGCWHWLLDDPRPLSRAFKTPGQQSLWDLPKQCRRLLR
jgi:hypothetical protein